METPILLDSIAGLSPRDHPDWLRFCEKISRLCPLDEASNSKRDGWISPYTFMEQLSEIADPDDSIVPCSSGGANTVAMQVFRTRQATVLQQQGSRLDKLQWLRSNRGLNESFGANGADRDGGFAQNLQDLATVAVNELNIKAFIFVNNGYASIRMTQSNYFGGRYIGCAGTGLGSPDWVALARALCRLVRTDEHFTGSARFQNFGAVQAPFCSSCRLTQSRRTIRKISSAS